MTNRLLLRLRVRRDEGALDAQLARGADPWASMTLMTRAAQLCTPTERRRVASSLEALVLLADHGWHDTPGIGLRRELIHRYRELLLALARRVRDVRPIPVAVIVRLRRLARDKDSPLYAGGRPASTLGHELAWVVLVLDGEQLAPLP